MPVLQNTNNFVLNNLNNLNNFVFVFIRNYIFVMTKNVGFK